MEFIVSKITGQQVKSMLQKPPHAIGVFAPAGSGKSHLALYLAKQLLGTQKPNAAQLNIVRPNEKGVITIEQARETLSFTKLKSHNNSRTSRVVIIENAQTMTTEAQNALLKIIEEPPVYTVIILAATNSSGILATIRSRLTSIAVSPPAKEDARRLYAKVSETEFNKAWVISSGRIGLMHAILTDSDNELLSDINTAKEILRSNVQQRISLIDGLQKSSIASLLDALLIVAKAGRSQALAKSADAQIRKWQNVIKKVLSSQHSLQHNPNQKLLLTNLMLEL